MHCWVVLAVRLSIPLTSKHRLLIHYRICYTSVYILILNPVVLIYFIINKTTSITIIPV